MAEFRVFVSVDTEFSDDIEEIDEFFDRFADAATFVRRDRALDAGLGGEDLRERYMDGADITLLLNGTCTHSRCSVDRELHASLLPGPHGLPNGLLVVNLHRLAQHVDLPPRAEANVASGYARFYRLPLSVDELQSWFADALDARVARAHAVDDSAPVLDTDGPCTPTYSPFTDRTKNRVGQL